MKGTKNLTQGPIYSQLFKLAMPIMATSFIQMAYSLTDMAWVGRLGSEAATVVGSVGIFVWMTTALSLLGKIGSEVSIAQSVGAQNEEDARSFASHNFTISLIISIIWGLIFIVFAHPIIDIFKLDGHDVAGGEIANNAVSYLRIISLGFPLIFLTSAFTGMYNSVGRSTIPFYISGTGLVFNMVLDPIFIFTFNLGTDGAGYATIISQAIVLLIFFYNIKYKNPILGGFAFFTRLKKKYTKRILKLGSPVALFNLLFAFVNLFLSRLASEYGGHIGVMTLTTGALIEGITWNTAQGFSTALGTFIAQNYAAGKYDRVIKAWHVTLKMTAVFGSLCTLLFVFFGSEVFSLFVPHEPEAFKAGGLYLQISGLSQLFMTLEITSQGVFYGIGRTTPPAIISIFFNYSRIPLALILTGSIAIGGIALGVEGIWWAVSITSICKGTFLTLWFVSIKNKVLGKDSKGYTLE
ncbi:MATE efflux family protein [Bacteroides coprosuis DSM 18011]|uniref:MATE efflux family protein n=1 Tax=Bacteroides coprosuis DSM 18011 TaxID=679937 RepID=F3ZUB7_9BACE|nr:MULTISPECIES: MATE family efflux transporter [Bacteroides]EGJ71362.1 MATE efflux family protein [Bacteroides coprosuis DSM 18011]HJD91377.1 MATE family efflux transporter [Bacteroides coprosuis]